MSDDAHQDELDWAKLDLQRFETVANAQASMLAAQANYEYRMMEVLEKRIKVETDKLRLRVMRDAFRDFVRQRHELLALLDKARNRAARTSEQLRWLRRLAKGEYLDPDLVAFVWGAFYFVLDQCDEATIDSIPVPADITDRAYYVHQQQPVGELPAEVNHPRALIMWLRSRNFMPKIGSPPYTFLLLVLAALAADAHRRAAVLLEQTDAIAAELQRLQSADWQTVAIQLPVPPSST